MSVQHKRLQQQVDQLRAELAAAKGLLARIHRDGGHHTEDVGVAQSIADASDKVSEWLLAVDERDRLAADNARLREALGNLILDCQRGPGFTVSKPYRKTITDAQAAIRSCPAQSLAAHDAALLRCLAEKLAGEGHPANEYYRNWLMAEAERTEKEAPHA